LVESLRALLSNLPGLLCDRITLLSLEAHRAGLALGQIVLWMVAASILGVTAWLALCSAIVIALVEYGLAWAPVLLGVVVVNLAAALFALFRARALAPRLALPATRRHLIFDRLEADG
jgi:hypothetical protein